MQTELRRRAVLRLAGIVGITGGAALLAACSQAAAPGAPTAAATTVPAANPTSVATRVPAPVRTPDAPPSTQQPKTGGTLRWGLLGNIITLDGHNYAGANHILHVFDRLILLDEHLNWQPRLAESWDVSPDYTRFTLHLRKGVQFHSGRELTGDDVLWNFSRVKDPSVGAGIFAAFVAPLQSVESPDKYSVVITARQPYPYIGQLLQTLNILDPVSMQQPDGVNHPVGTGPFKFVEFAQGDHLTLARNAQYWRSGLPYVDQLHMPIFTDPQTMLTAFESGGLDAAVNVPLRDAARLRNDKSYQLIVNQNSGASYGLICNTTVDPTGNKLLRQALQYAIDRQRIADTVLLGFGVPNNLPWFPTSPAYDAAKDRSYTFDLEKAKSLLQQASVANAAFDFNYSTAIPELGTMGQIIQADLARIGVTLSLKPTDPPELQGMQFQVKYPGISGGTYLFGQSHPGSQFGSPYWGALNNWTGIKDDQFRAVSTAMSTEVDPARAKQAYAAWNDYVLDQSFAISIATFLPRMATSARVHGVHYDMAYILDGTEAWLG